MATAGLDVNPNESDLPDEGQQTLIKAQGFLIRFLHYRIPVLTQGLTGSAQGLAPKPKPFTSRFRV